MIILLPISTAQEVIVSVREHFGIQYLVRVTDESTNLSTDTITEGSLDDGQLTINVTVDFTDKRFYILQIFSLLGGTEYQDFIDRVIIDGGIVEAKGCLNFEIAELMAFAAESLITFQKIYITSQTDFENFSVMQGYYTQPTKDKLIYTVKP
jgi:hypothetical protein